MARTATKNMQTREKCTIFFNRRDLARYKYPNCPKGGDGLSQLCANYRFACPVDCQR